MIPYGDVGARVTHMAAAVTRQLGQAVYGTPLASVGAEQHPQDFLSGAINNRGAYLRAAYWQAVGSRIVQGRGQASTALTAAATGAQGAAMAGGSSLGFFTPTYWWFRPDDDGNVQQILGDAANRLAGYGLHDVAKIVSDTGSPGAVVLRERELEGQSYYDKYLAPVLDTVDPRPAWMKTRLFTGAAGSVVLVFGALIGLGLFAMLVKWALAPYITPARTAYRAASSMRRR